MFDKVLIANRGEIACRIAAVLAKRGIKSVAVYSEADAEAVHTRAADEAIAIGPSPARESYLNQDAVIAAAKATGAQAIHPGYGLLSENAGFARRCAAEGIVFIGPTPEVIEGMGDKAKARATAEAAGVPVVPGSDGPVESLEEAQAIAERIGYPVLVKAAAGGGGIGMTVVKKPARLGKALDSCRDRGLSSFGSGTVYLEKYIENPRHIEVQILFDHHGHGVHLFERECTLQRRHQKVIEEAPSPFVSERPELRERITGAAMAAARAIGYRNAGTVEFIVSQEGEFYFIETNTRLQVEHPVTEAITGVDLIGAQLDIAFGEHLTLQQADLEITGHAIECRIYAEDPDRKFVPRPGPVGRFEPPTVEGVHVDAGIGPNQQVTHFYDPMVAKLIAVGSTREEATARARAGLDGFIIETLTTNRAFLIEVLDTDVFKSHSYDTGWLQRWNKTR